MHTIQERRICTHFRWERIKQAAGFQKDIHTLIYVSDKDHGCRSGLFFLAAGKGTGCHVVFHDLHAVFILKMNPGNLIKRYTVPKADKPHLLPCHVIEQVGNGGLSAGNQYAVRRYFFIQMRFARAPWAKLAQIEVILNKWQHSGQKQPFLTVLQFVRFHTNGT